MKIYLASRSPRRRELLEQIGVTYEVVDVDVDETHTAGETPASLVVRLAEAKARAGLAALGTRAPAPVLGADTVVVLDGDVLGKPRDSAHASDMLARLSGREHTVLSAVAIALPGRCVSRSSETRVRMRTIAPDERAAYCASGEPLDKAGAYAVQGRAAEFVEYIAGSYTGVVGLPLFETSELLRATGPATTYDAERRS